MSNEDGRQYLTFTLREWLAIVFCTVGLAFAFQYDTRAQASWASPLAAALAQLPHFTGYMAYALYFAAFVTTLRLAIEGLYGLMRPFPALSENRNLGVFARWVGFYLAIIVISLAFLILAHKIGLNLVWP